MSLLQNSTLKSVKVSGEIYDSIGQFDVEQIYLSTNQNPLEIYYQFALDNNSIITNVSLQIGDKKMYGIINEKHSNRQNYEKAIENKQTALTLEKNFSGDYTLRLGNIEPNINIILKYTYITYLKIVNSTFIFNLPTNIAPKYNQIKSNLSNIDKISYSDNIEYDFNINILLKSMNQIKNIDCNNCKTNVNKLNDNEYHINSITNPQDGDFVITFNTELKPCAYKYKEYYAINFNFPTENYKSDIPKSYSIIIDRSGSMGGTKIDNAKDALKLFVSSLPKDSYFNIISFGNSYMGLYQSPVKYSDKNIKIALNHINNMSANMGGTELYKCLEDCIRQKVEFYQEKSWLNDSISSDSSDSSDNENIIIILTDGQVSGHKLKEIINNNSDKKFRIFTLGIGNDANKLELENIALNGYGICRMSSESKDIADNVIDILDYTNKLYYKNITYNDKIILKCAYPNIFTQIFLKMENHNEDIILKTSEKDFYVKSLHIEKEKFISQFYIDYQIKNNLINYNEIIPNSIKYSLLTKKTSFFLYSNEKIDTDGILETEKIKHYSSQLDCMILENLSCQRERSFDKLGDLQEMSYTFEPSSRRFEKKSAKLKSHSLGWFYSRDSKEESSEPNIINKAYDSISKGITKLFTKQLNKEENETTDSQQKNNKTIIDYKLADGSFDMNDNLIKLCNFELDKFYQLSTKLNIIPKILINYIVLIKLEKLKGNKYKLIIQNLIVFLIETDKNNYSKNYEEIKKIID